MADIPMVATTTAPSVSSFKAASFVATSSSKGLNLIQNGSNTLFTKSTSKGRQRLQLILGFIPLLDGSMYVFAFTEICTTAA
jgi:hypothetical protein